MKLLLRSTFHIVILSTLFSCSYFHMEEQKGSLLAITDENPHLSENSKTTTTFPKNNSSIHYGIDISHYQGNFLEKLTSSDSLHFVICKATQGEHYVDPKFHYNWKESKEKGLIRGAYHFYDCSVDPKAQAKHFINVVQTIEPTDIAPVLNIEQDGIKKDITDAQMVKDIKEFLSITEKELGRKPILYTGYAFAQEHFKNSGLNQYKLWLAEYTSKEEPEIPDEWKDEGYFIWQKSQNYQSHSTQLDYDEYIGDLQDIVNE